MTGTARGKEEEEVNAMRTLLAIGISITLY